MSTTATEPRTQLPVGTWKLDPTHSSASFAVKHMVVATFRGRFENLDATLTVGEDGGAELIGTVAADSIVVKDENLQAHLGSPDFFDTERYPELRFASSSLRRDGEELVLDGELTIKGHTHPVEARGTITDPHETLGGAVKIGVTLETVIDRTQYGLEWNAPLPKGGFALADDVKLTVELELARAEEQE
ncbi:MAG TPA: YceI family protein [Solirubrobacteraceae bacterium]|nr:YceI family protein [Solirubrobacteraceae bacterium]